MDTAKDTPAEQHRMEKEDIEDLGTVTLSRGGHVIHCLTVIGQIEGHTEAPQGQKTTKYEHVIPQLVAVQEDPRIEGLLVLLTLLFVCFLFRGEKQVALPQESYAHAPLLKGFTEGYNTMDTIAALNFGLVISTTLGTFGLAQKRDKMRYTVLAGLLAGTILALVYAMLSYMGMCSSGVYAIQENGAWTLRCIVYQLFGAPGAVLLAAIFTLACLTTCVGLINSISQYFSTLFGKLSYRQWVLVMTGFSFLVCNLGLNAILSISIPILNAIYPVAIVLILLGLTHSLWVKNRWVYSLVVAGTGTVSVIYALDAAQLSLGAVTELCRKLPLYDMGFCWVNVAAVMLAVSLLLGLVRRERA